MGGRGSGAHKKESRRRQEIGADQRGKKGGRDGGREGGRGGRGGGTASADARAGKEEPKRVQQPGRRGAQGLKKRPGQQKASDESAVGAEAAKQQSMVLGLPFSVNGFAGQTKALQVRSEELWGSKGGGVGGGEGKEVWG